MNRQGAKVAKDLRVVGPRAELDDLARRAIGAARGVHAVEAIEPIHVARVLSYSKSNRLPPGLLVDFNVTLLQRGIKRAIQT